MISQGVKCKNFSTTVFFRLLVVVLKVSSVKEEKEIIGGKKICFLIDRVASRNYRGTRLRTTDALDQAFCFKFKTYFISFLISKNRIFENQFAVFFCINKKEIRQNHPWIRLYHQKKEKEKKFLSRKIIILFSANELSFLLKVFFCIYYS